jgi:hypothetical protein
MGTAECDPIKHSFIFREMSDYDYYCDSESIESLSQSQPSSQSVYVPSQTSLSNYDLVSERINKVNVKISNIRG